jgi:hypothetical protein
MSVETVVSTIISAIDFVRDFGQAHPFQALFAFFGLLLGLVIGFFLLVMLPFGIGLFAMDAAGKDLSGANDKDFWKVWLVGHVTIGASLLLIVLLVGFVRFVWYAWA